MALKKSQLYQGSFSPTMLELTNGLSLQIWTIVPAVNFDAVATNGYAWFVGKGPPDWSNTNNAGGPLCYRKLQWQGTNAVWGDTNWTVLSNTVPTYQNYFDLDGTNITVLATNGLFAPDPGNSIAVPLYVTSSRMMSAVIRNGSLWTSQTVGLKGTNGTYSGGSSFTNVDRTAIQWLQFQVNTNSGSLSFTNYGRIYDTATNHSMYYYLPSLMVNGNGDMLTGFNGSSVGNYIGAYYNWRLANGAMLSQPGLIQAGSTNWDDPLQWGDYSATALDPTDELSFWTVQAYPDALQHRSQPWATGVGKILPHP